MASLMDAISIGLENRNDLLASASDLLAEFADSDKYCQRVTDLVCLRGPLFLTRKSLETILSIFLDNPVASHSSNLLSRLATFAHLMSPIAPGRLGHTTRIVLQDLPGGKVDVDGGEYFPGRKTASLLQAAHVAMNPARLSLARSAPKPLRSLFKNQRPRTSLTTPTFR